MYPCEKLPRLVNRVLPPPERRIAYKNLNVHQITVGTSLAGCMWNPIWKPNGYAFGTSQLGADLER